MMQKNKAWLIAEASSALSIQRPSTSMELISKFFLETYFPLKTTLSCKQSKKLFYRVLLLFVFLHLTHASFSQEHDSIQGIVDFKGSVSVTNNGFSFIPSFSLGKPATIVDLSIGNRFSFDPQFRFDLEGLKPWSLIFIWRYQLIQTERFKVIPGVHLPAISFRTTTIEVNGVSYEEVYAQRFLTPELTTSYTLTRNISVGTYYIYGLGLEKINQSKHTHFFSLRSSFNNIQLSKKVWLRWDPQVYYLRVDENDGYYLAHSLSLGVKDFPLLLSTTMNKSVKTDVTSKDFDWNISLVYAFRNQWVRK